MIVTAKKWGNSIGVIIPKKIVMSLKMKAGEEYVISKIEKKTNVLKDAFGALPDLSQKDLEEFRKNEKFSKYD